MAAITTTGCSGIIGDRVYSVNAQTNSFTLNSTQINGNIIMGTESSCLNEQPSDFVYSACTVMSSPASIALVGSSGSGSAEMYTVRIPSSGQCQIESRPHSLSGMSHALSVVPAPCSSQTTSACFAILGLSSNSTSSPQYVIQYTSSSSGESSSAIDTLPPTSDTTIHPMLAVLPNDTSKLYVIGYPTKDQILVRPNGYQSSIPASSQSLAQVPTSSGVLLARRIPNTNTLVARAGDTYIKLDSSIDNMGPAIPVGDNIVIVSNSSLTVQTVPVALSGDLRVARVDLLPSSEISGASSFVGIDSVVPLPSNDGSSSVFVTYHGDQGNHIMTSMNEPALFTSNDSGSSDNNPSNSGNENTGSSFSTGAIVGIVIGCTVAGILLKIGFILLYRRRRQRQQNKKQPLGEEEGDISMADRHFLSEKLATTPTNNYQSVPIKDDVVGVSDNSDDDGQASAALATIASLTRTINNSPMHNNDDYYEPTSANDTLLLESFAYSLHNEAPTYALFPQGYATRSATRTLSVSRHQQQQPIECTVHYFPASAATWFGQLLQTTISLQDRQQSVSPDDSSSVYGGGGGTFGLFTYDAIALSEPTKHGNYQYLWITSPYHLHHSLHYLLFDGHTVVDCTQFSFKAWSTLSMLKALQQTHECGWIHRKINTFSFFYDQASTVTDWSLTGFYQAKLYTGQSETHPRLTAEGETNQATDLLLDDCSAPEWIHYMENNRRAPIISQPSMDIWSLGCVLYTVATGKRAFQHVHEYQSLLAQSGQPLQAKLDIMLEEAALVDETYKELLHRMLQIDPHARDSLSSLIDYWIHSNQLDDDE